MLFTNQNDSQKSTSCHLLKVATVMLGTAVTLTACGGHEEEVKAVDKVEEAAELARANAPEPEPLVIDETAASEATAAMTTEGDTTDGMATDGMATDVAATTGEATPAEGAMTTEGAEPTEGAASADMAEVPASTETPASDTPAATQ